MRKPLLLVTKLIFFTLLLCGIIFSALGDWEHIPGQMAVNVLQAPTPMLADNKAYLVYELYLTNFHTAPLTLNTLTISTDKDQTPLFTFKGAELANLLKPIGKNVDTKTTPSLTLPAGAGEIVFVWLPFANATVIPSHLVHKFTFATTHNGKPLTLATTTDPLAIHKTLPVIVAAPLKGDNWIACGGPSNTSYHRRTGLIFNGHDYFAQRYAIDFMQIGKDGKTFHDDPSQNKNYYCYGKDILSAAAGTVVEVKDGLAENTPHHKTMAVPMDMDTVGGNHVVIDIGHGHYAFYAHMIPGSLKVKVGDTVAIGQVIGKVGNTGNSTEPHLHFHIVNKPSFLAADGIPYGFGEFSVRPSKLISPDPKIQIQVLNDSLQQETDQLVLENTVMKFAD